MSTDKEKYVGKTSLSQQPKSPFSFKLKDRSIKERHFDDAAVTTPKIKDKAVTPEKLNDSVKNTLITPAINSIDEKYGSITNELYLMVRSLQVGGVALSGKLGNREDIGIHQKSLSKIFNKLWEVLGEITGKVYMDYTLTVEPILAYADGDVNVTIIADCSESVSDFDEVKVYVDNELVGEDENTVTYTITVPKRKTSVVKVEGTILGKTIIKTQEVVIETPFFIGSGNVYTDAMNEECRKEIIGTLQGEYDMTVKHTGDYIFIIIPSTRREEFRRAKIDMNGFEIPILINDRPDYIICQSVNTYQTGNYNIDIDIND